MIDIMPDDWPAETAQRARVELRRFLLRRALGGVALLTAGWCGLVLAAVGVPPSGAPAAAIGAGCGALVVTGVRALARWTPNESVLAGALAAIGGVPLVIGLVLDESVPTLIGMVPMGIVSAAGFFGYSRMYARLTRPPAVR